MNSKIALLFTACCVVLAGCAGLRPGFETPTVTVNSFRAVPSNGMVPDFEIGLRVVNPNPVKLELAGISYTISLAGNELIKGVASELPAVAAYGEGDVKLTASANMFAGARLISDLMRQNSNSVAYSFEAKLDLVGLAPTIRVRDSGDISLASMR